MIDVYKSNHFFVDLSGGVGRLICANLHDQSTFSPRSAKHVATRMEKTAFQDLVREFIFSLMRPEWQSANKPQYRD